MTQADVARALDEIGVLLQLAGENDFRTRAYTSAARTVEQLDADLGGLVAAGSLGTVRGLGPALVDKITTLVTTGRLPYLEALRAKTPPGLLAMLQVPGLGPKKAKALYDALAIDGLPALEAACLDGRVERVKGFGAKTAANILEGVRFLAKAGGQVRFDKAVALAAGLLDRLRHVPGVTAAEVCGSVRRRAETVKDIDLLVATPDPAAVTAAFVGSPEVVQVVGTGPTKSSVVARVPYKTSHVTLAADLRVVTPAQFPFALLHFTGSKAHNVRLRQRAADRDLVLNEYELRADAGPVPCATEADIYAELGLTWIPPELREDAGEIEKAEAGPLPDLVTPGDIRGVFHNHTTASDGSATLQDMALAAGALGYTYFGVGDHSQSLTVANGLTPARVRAQWAEIDGLNARLTGVRVLKGTECDILADGSLDFPDDLLAGFDYVVVSVHSLFHLPEPEQTARVCKALAHPAATMLGHATGRLLLRRDGYKIDLDAVIRAAAAHGKMIEINAQPDRLDLDWRHARRAKTAGVPLVINPDAHSPDDLAKVPFGVNVARKAGLTPADVFNTRDVGAVLAALGRG